MQFNFTTAKTYGDESCPNCYGNGFDYQGKDDDRRLAYCFCVRQILEQAEAEGLEDTSRITTV